MLKTTSRIMAVALLGSCLSLPVMAQTGAGGGAGGAGSSDGTAGESGSRSIERQNNAIQDPRAPGNQQNPATTGSVTTQNCNQRWNQMRSSAMAQGMTQERFHADCMAGKM